MTDKHKKKIDKMSMDLSNEIRKVLEKHYFVINKQLKEDVNSYSMDDVEFIMWYAFAEIVGMMLSPYDLERREELLEYLNKSSKFVATSFAGQLGSLEVVRLKEDESKN